MTKRIWAVFSIILVLVIALLVMATVKPLYDEEEAKVAIGDVYSLSDGWTVEFENGITLENVSIPYSFDSHLGDSVTLSHDMAEEYASLALNFEADNSAVRVFMDGKPIYEAGFSDTGVAPDLGDMSEKPDEDAVMRDNTSIKTVAGEITVDLPSNITEESKMRVVLAEVNTRAGINIIKATISKRDVTVINVLRESMLPILCTILIMMLTVIVLSLDVTRYISGERMRGLFIVALMGIDAIGFMILQTDLLKLFFANRYFFDKLAVICILLMPMLLALFYYIGFHTHFPKITNIGICINIIFTIVVLILEASASNTALLLVEPFTFALYLYQLISIFILLHQIFYNT